MDALGLLQAPHDEVDARFAKIEAADDPATKPELVAELADNLAAHAKLEETLCYPAVKAKTTEEMLHAATEAHLAIKRVLADRLGLDPSDEQSKDHACR